MEGFDLGRAHHEAPHDPGRAAREAADRIAGQVRDILESAEQRAGEIRSNAETDAEAIRREASEATARMLDRVEALEGQLGTYLTDFFESIREELSQLAARQEVDAAAAEPRFDPGPQAERALQPVEPLESEPGPEPVSDEDEEEPRRRRGLIWSRRERERDPEPALSAAGEEAEDAHVMALNMALNGTPRAETQSYLRQRFSQLEDLGPILDDVYGRVKRR